MQLREIVETDIGILWGRDCVYLDGVEMPTLSTLRLVGAINIRIVKGYKPPRGWEKVEVLPFTLDFTSVLGFRMLEHDVWGLQESDDNALHSSSFERVVNSAWIQSLAKGIHPEHLSKYLHYQVGTYDDVFDVISLGYELKFGNENA
jgi:hypothetical protein